MKSSNHSSSVCLTSGVAATTVLLLFVFVRPAVAIQRDFTIVTNQSSIAISGNVDSALGSSAIQQQGSGSLTTTYAGTIKTDLFASGISFLPGSDIDANVNGNWKPLADGTDGSAEADYG